MRLKHAGAHGKWSSDHPSPASREPDAFDIVNDALADQVSQFHLSRSSVTASVSARKYPGIDKWTDMVFVLIFNLQISRAGLRPASLDMVRKCQECLADLLANRGLRFTLDGIAAPIAKQRLTKDFRDYRDLCQHADCAGELQRGNLTRDNRCLFPSTYQKVAGVVLGSRDRLATLPDLVTDSVIRLLTDELKKDNKFPCAARLMELAVEHRKQALDPGVLASTKCISRPVLKKGKAETITLTDAAALMEQVYRYPAKLAAPGGPQTPAEWRAEFVCEVLANVATDTSLTQLIPFPLASQLLVLGNQPPSWGDILAQLLFDGGPMCLYQLGLWDHLHCGSASISDDVWGFLREVAQVVVNYCSAPAHPPCPHGVKRVVCVTQRTHTENAMRTAQLNCFDPRMPHRYVRSYAMDDPKMHDEDTACNKYWHKGAKFNGGLFDVVCTHKFPWAVHMLRNREVFPYLLLCISCWCWRLQSVHLLPLLCVYVALCCDLD